MGDIFSGYDTADLFDEVFHDDGSVRPHYRGLVDRLRGLSSQDLGRRERIRDGIFRTQGITSIVYGEEEGGPSGPSRWTCFRASSRTTSEPRSRRGSRSGSRR